MQKCFFKSKKNEDFRFILNSITLIQLIFIFRMKASFGVNKQTRAG